MTDKQKPPMAVWTGGHRTGFLATTTEPSDMTPDGPYVHLDQFIEEVMEGSKYAHDNGLVGNPVLWAMRELAEKLKEQNEN